MTYFAGIWGFARLRLIGFKDDRHILVIGGNRSGKGATFIVPNLCLWPGSVLVLDPKGENAMLTAARRGRGGKGVIGMGQLSNFYSFDGLIEKMLPHAQATLDLKKTHQTDRANLQRKKNIKPGGTKLHVVAGGKKK